MTELEHSKKTQQEESPIAAEVDEKTAHPCGDMRRNCLEMLGDPPKAVYIDHGED